MFYVTVFEIVYNYSAKIMNISYPMLHKSTTKMNPFWPVERLVLKEAVTQPREYMLKTDTLNKSCQSTLLSVSCTQQSQHKLLATTVKHISLYTFCSQDMHPNVSMASALHPQRHCNASRRFHSSRVSTYFLPAHMLTDESIHNTCVSGT